MKYYLIAGEASGDLHASNLIKELKVLDKDAVLRGWGGDLMENEGMKLIKHYKELAFMGFAEVVLNLRTILNNIKICKKDIITFKPDALILIDYPGFNLRIAEWAHKNGIKVFYYIAPQVWAWHQSRIKKMKQIIDQLYVILPFEKEFFGKHNMDVNFVGHPLLDAIENHSIDLMNANKVTIKIISEKPIVALLPGSRKQEIKTMLPYMIELSELYPEYQFIIGGVRNIPKAMYDSLIPESENISIVYGQTYNLLKKSVLAIVTSGTATLETALFGIPQIVCYKGNFISYQIARRFIKIKYISLVNLIMDMPLIKELIQNELNIINLKSEFDKILNDKIYKDKFIEGYKEMKVKLGGKGASANTAKLINNKLFNNQK